MDTLYPVPRRVFSFDEWDEEEDNVADFCQAFVPRILSFAEWDEQEDDLELSFDTWSLTSADATMPILAYTTSSGLTTEDGALMPPPTTP
jgi:hypothetical protein